MREPNKKRTHINYLRKFRRARGLKLKDATVILGLRSSSTLSRWENGAALPDSINLLRLSALYRTFVDALFPEIAFDLKQQLIAHEARASNSSHLANGTRRVEIESMGSKPKVESISKSRRRA